MAKFELGHEKGNAVRQVPGPDQVRGLPSPTPLPLATTIASSTRLLYTASTFFIVVISVLYRCDKHSPVIPRWYVFIHQ